jgi:exodeoxyribonuclease VIII
VRKLLNGEHEKPFFWTDEATDEDCKCRVDCLTDIGGKPYIIDYKTCSDASNDAFMRDAIKYGYHVQAAMYSDGVERNIGVKPTFVFIAQEKAEPYAINIFQADEAFVQYGEDVFRELIGVYHYCKQNDLWYGYLGRQQIINNLQLPAWMAKE